MSITIDETPEPSAPHKDVTADVKFGAVDDECLPLTRCLCGAAWNAWHGPVLSYTSRETAEECPVCLRRFYFTNDIRVWEVV